MLSDYEVALDTEQTEKLSFDVMFLVIWQMSMQVKYSASSGLASAS